MAVSYKYHSNDPFLTSSINELILDKLRKIGSEVLAQVSWPEIEKGKTRYLRFEDNGHKWLRDDYETEGFQAVYCENLFFKRAELISLILLDFDAQYQLPNLFYHDTTLKTCKLSVISFGCGPGNDLTGFQAFYLHLKQVKKSILSESQQLKLLKCVEEAEINLIGYDSAKGWGKYLDVLGYTFKHQMVDYNFVTQMEPVDVIILSYLLITPTSLLACINQKPQKTMYETGIS